MVESFKIVSFYEFKRLGDPVRLAALKILLRDALERHKVCGTIIIATEGFNATLCGTTENVTAFLVEAEAFLETTIDPKISHHHIPPFRKHEVRIKPEIVTLKRPVDLALGEGTHVNAKDWNELISDPDVLVLDTRNDYEFRSGTFNRAVNPKTKKFSDLPRFVEEDLDPKKHKKIAMFCTGGIRCEKFVPFMKGLGFEDVYQLSGGILKYLEVVPPEEQLWEGECFVFDERVTLNRTLEKGSRPDFSQRHAAAESDRDLK